MYERTKQNVLRVAGAVFLVSGLITAGAGIVDPEDKSHYPEAAIDAAENGDEERADYFRDKAWTPIYVEIASKIKTTRSAADVAIGAACFIVARRRKQQEVTVPQPSRSPR